jgi:hypothetical protein
MALATDFADHDGVSTTNPTADGSLVLSSSP